MIRFPRQAVTVRVRYPRHPRRFRRVLGIAPYLKDGTPIQSWRLLEDGCLECVLSDGSKRVVLKGRFEMGLRPHR